MSWLPISDDDIKTRLSGPELAAFRAAALATGQQDPIGDVVAQTVDVVRGYIAACQRNVQGPDGTIPQKLKQAALSLIVMDIMSRAAGTVLDPKGQRKEAADKATKLLEQVAACRFAIDKPDEFTTEIVQNFTPSFSRHHRHTQFSREDQFGI
jgi:hypothetical protein